jgi:hypothetical protein
MTHTKVRQGASSAMARTIVKSFHTHVGLLWGRRVLRHESSLARVLVERALIQAWQRLSATPSSPA